MDGNVSWATLIQATDTNAKNLGRWPSHKHGIYVRFACSKYISPTCKAAHLEHKDCPREWVDKAAAALKAGADKVAAEGGGDGG